MLVPFEKNAGELQRLAAARELESSNVVIGRQGLSLSA